MNDVIREIKSTIKDKTVIIAVSGGPDSMCILNLFQKAKVKIVVAHINHNLRDESKKEAQMVKKYCTNNNIEFEYREIKEYKGNIENYARKKRYEFFKELIKKYNSEYLVTAHHADDLTETVIMRLIKGSNIRQLIAFKKISKRDNYYLYRPLINKTKIEILDYCTNNKIPYALDSSNKSDKYTRNRIRKYIVPQLKKENKLVHKNFVKFTNKLSQYENYIEKSADIIKQSVYKNKVLDVKTFNKQDTLIKEKIIYSILKDTYKNEITKIKEKHIKEIIKILNQKEPNKKIILPQNKIFIKSYNEAKIEKREKIKAYNYILKDEIKLIDNHIIKIVKGEEDNSNNTIKLSKKDIKLPLHIKVRENGDKIELKGLNGSKKIKDIFIDEKIPKEIRNIYPIMTDDDGKILWIPGIKKSKFDVSNSKNYDIIIRYF